MLDDIDREIIQATQAGLPLTPEPYQTLAEQLGLSAEEVMQRLSAMQDSGIIRRIGAVPNHYKLGYRFNGMTVWNVPDEQNRCTRPASRATGICQPLLPPPPASARMALQPVCHGARQNPTGC